MFSCTTIIDFVHLIANTIHGGLDEYLVRGNGGIRLAALCGFKSIGKERGQSDSISDDGDLHQSLSATGKQPGRTKTATYHVETLVGVLLCSRTTHAVDTGPLSVIDSRLADPLNRSLEVFMECAHDGTADVVSQIPGSNEQDIDAGDLGNLLYLYQLN